MGPQIEMMDFTWMSTMLKQRMIPSKKSINKRKQTHHITDANSLSVSKL